MLNFVHFVFVIWICNEKGYKKSQIQGPYLNHCFQTDCDLAVSSHLALAPAAFMFYTPFYSSAYNGINH